MIGSTVRWPGASLAVTGGALPPETMLRPGPLTLTRPSIRSIVYSFWPGYTGEDGWEIMLPADEAAAFWGRLQHQGVMPCGLGARDTLRLEAGMNLYGTDIDESTSPLVSGLGWTIAWEPGDRDFIGRDALASQKARGVPSKQVGLVLADRGVLRSHQKVIVASVGEGEVTSGTFSPTLERSIGLARVPTQTADRCEVEIRGRLLAASVVRPPFVRHGKIAIPL